MQPGFTQILCEVGIARPQRERFQLRTLNGGHAQFDTLRASLFGDGLMGVW
ncbi:hypothetical protein BURPS1655_K0557 [Burkholderia pseudomallei 1655]|nr:hypothetical protein BURPS1655_K0557 [Burkholderia pseudomallei 1655]